MSTQFQFRRGTTSEHASFVGAQGEITVDTTKKVVVVHDGSTVGGVPMAKEAIIPYEATASNIKINGTQSVGTLSTVARGDHVHPTDTSRAPLASPAFTGTPTAPTPVNTENSTILATTAWVRSAMATIMSALGFAISLGTNSYIKFPSCLGNLIIQWGNLTSVADNATVAIVYPIAFTTIVLYSSGSYTTDTVTTGTDVISTTTRSATGMTLRCAGNNTSANVNWLAIGY